LRRDEGLGGAPFEFPRGGGPWRGKKKGRDQPAEGGKRAVRQTVIALTEEEEVELWESFSRDGWLGEKRGSPQGERRLVTTSL